MVAANKRIKKAGEADERLIHDLENQLENRAVKEIYDNDEPYHYGERRHTMQMGDAPEEAWPIWFYILIGMAIGLVLVLAFILTQEEEMVINETEAQAAMQQEPPQEKFDTESITYKKRGATIHGEGSPNSTMDLVKENAIPAACVAGIVGLAAHKYNFGGFRDLTNKVKDRVMGVKKPKVHIPTAGECRAQGKILKGSKCANLTWQENPKLKAEHTANMVAKENTKFYDNLGRDVATVANKIPGVNVDAKKMQLSSYSWGNMAGLVITGGALIFAGKWLYGLVRGTENPETDVTDEDGNLLTSFCSSQTEGDKSEESPLVKKLKENKTIIMVVIAALCGACVWFLPAIVALLPGPVQGMMSPAVGLVNSGKGAILGMIGMGPTGPLLG